MEPRQRRAVDDRRRVDLRIEIHGERDVGGLGDRLLNAGEFPRQDADDRHLHQVRRDHLADNRRVAPEPRPPVALADDGDRRCRGAIVVGDEHPADAGVHAEHAEVVPGREECRCQLRLTVQDHVHTPGGRTRKQVRHRLVVFDELLVDGVGEGRAHDTVGVAVVARVGRHLVTPLETEPHESVRILHRDSGQQHRVHCAEDRGVGAYPQGKRCHHHSRPAFGVQEHPQAVAKIFQHENSVSNFAALKGWTTAGPSLTLSQPPNHHTIPTTP